ncbi:MAG TPA: hypothetical protein VFV85_03085, partial [Conexibacter sp.]|nr:hypothetical protein [Conexibacter sp.]
MGDAGAVPLGGTPAARRAVALLRERGVPGTAGGRLVRVADGRDARAAADAAAHVAALCAQLGRGATAAGVPAAVA